VRRRARLVLRVVYVASARAVDARRRVADVLLRAAFARDSSRDDDAPGDPASEPPTSPREKAA
jgi:hypothetical protein